MTSAAITQKTAATPQSGTPRSKAAAGAKGAVEAKQSGFSFLNRTKKIKEFTKKEQVDMFRGLGSMLRAQINTADALKYYGQGLQNKGMSDCLAAIRTDINAGMNVHEAFRRTKRFNETIVGLIQAGSDAGQLHEAFRSLAGRISSELRFTKAIKKATVMPGIIIAVLQGAFIMSQVKICTTG